MSPSRPLPIPPQHPGEQVDPRPRTPPPVYLVDNLRTPSARPLPLPPEIQPEEIARVVMPAEESLPRPNPANPFKSYHLLLQEDFRTSHVARPFKTPKRAQLLLRGASLSGFSGLLYRLDRSMEECFKSRGNANCVVVDGSHGSGDVFRYCMGLPPRVRSGQARDIARFSYGVHNFRNTPFPGASKWQDAAEGFVQVGFLHFRFPVALVWKVLFPIQCEIPWS
ncbi:hypothetical protein E1B28_011500 [Marasmius oreades]|uniref:Uncharacterized protein n=1 Tax=Marasmius oreades TaxID=181124 RepID=A0A9P7RVA8_9AGAR|nr:uncharacterized protein E1B28_011500 [Marasmius oreades]KAG7089856.1 hypothetical protein E1B28_011500 [Marasmius oreades]